MAVTGSGTSTVAAPATTGQYTLAQLVTIVRRRLDDTTPEYLWSNEEITSYFDVLQKELSGMLGLIEDRTTSEICEIAVAGGFETLDIDYRIINIRRATLASAPTSRLLLVDSAYMDTYYPTWEDEVNPATGTPTCLIIDGVGDKKVRLYPTPTTADTLKLVVYRTPLYTLEWSEHQNWPLEVDKYAHFMIDGVLAQAYSKQDVDTFNEKKAAQHRDKWEGQNGGKEKIRRLYLQQMRGSYTAEPMAAFM